jgi:hypothetical protein
MLGRNIVDNIFLAQKAMEWAIHSKQDLALLLLDFEKAFDKIDLGFMFSTFKSLGFCEAWVNWVSNLYKVMVFTIKINDIIGDSFSLSWSVKQACLLPPYLFILVFNVLSYLLDNPKYGVIGFNLLGVFVIQDHTFVDNTALYITEKNSNLEKTKIIFNLFKP